MMQAGGILGPDGKITFYEMTEIENDAVVTFVSDDAEEPRQLTAPMYRSDLLHILRVPYHIDKPKMGWRTEFSEAEKEKLRPIAETLALLDGNAFFTVEVTEGKAWYEMYLPSASALYDANGGDDGWAGEASFARAIIQRRKRE